MHLKKLKIQNFRCYKEIEVSFNPQVNVFVGNNGAGKSAILDAVSGAFFPYIQRLLNHSGFRRKEYLFSESDLRVSEGRTAKELVFETHLADERTWKVMYSNSTAMEGPLRPRFDVPHLANLWLMAQMDADDPTPIPILAYYGSNRNIEKLSDVKSMANRKFGRIDAFQNALHAAADYDDVAEWFFFREVEELQQGRERQELDFRLHDLSQVRRAVTSIIKQSTRVFFRQKEKATLMVEWIDDKGDRKELTLKQLSDGFRNMLALVMDYARRMAQANPHQDDPLAVPGILLIDEIDLHLHPQWQQTIIPDLVQLFPNTQLIVTTHSPEVVTTVRQSQVQILEDYQVYPCPSPTFGMSSAEVVRSVLGVKQLRPDNEVSKDIKSLFDAIDTERLDDAKALRAKLRQWDRDGFDPDLVRADMGIRRLERRGIQ